MFNIALYQPEIPPNTGNIMRLCANTGSQLHLIHPLGFQLDEKKIRRSGMDYRDMSVINEYETYADFLENIPDKSRLFALTTKGSQTYSKLSFQPGDTFLFGPETRGLPAEVLEAFPPEQRLRLPMLTDSRSLNLSNTAAIMVYEALRQQDFANLR
jgi:tRNA (cytidine/uridine-2'-O-)-methyltransferase